MLRYDISQAPIDALEVTFEGRWCNFSRWKPNMKHQCNATIFCCQPYLQDLAAAFGAHI